MNTITLNKDFQTSDLIKTILQWPEWKKESVCIDQSDIELFEKISDLCSSSENK